MIRSLKRKYIIVMTLLAALLLAFMFVAVGAVNIYRAREHTRSALQIALAGPKGDQNGLRRVPMTSDPPIPTFTVIVGVDGNVRLIWVQNIDRSVEGFDEYILEAAQIAANGDASGVIPSLGLRYSKVEQASFDMPRSGELGVNGELRIAFADVTTEVSQVRQTLYICLLSFVAGVAGFFIISCGVSGWIVGPVERAWNDQRRFVADASHELKTPLTVILANMGILALAKSDTVDSQWKWIENTEEEARKMRRLVDQMLFLAKTDGVRDDCVFESVDLSNVVEGACLAFESVAFDAGVEIDITNVSRGIVVNGDATLLERVVSILLDNAVKYSTKSKVIEVALSRHSSNAVLTVRNFGDTIDEATLAHMFERFYRADSARSSEGYGLGLAIARNIALLHGGSIKASSGVNDGTVFDVTIPVGNVRRALPS